MWTAINAWALNAWREEVGRERRWRRPGPDGPPPLPQTVSGARRPDRRLRVPGDGVAPDRLVRPMSRSTLRSITEGT